MGEELEASTTGKYRWNGKDDQGEEISFSF